ncbi:MAG: tol-pal system-associated acyl-CoA thioesterase [Granulosicoccus sp.]
MSHYSLPVRVYIEDTDAGGIVYYANYLNYMERARTEWLRECGIELDHLQYEHRTLFVVRSLTIEYRRPARFNDQLTVQTHLRKIRQASVECDQPVYRDSTLLSESRVLLACVDADKLSPTAIPPFIREAMTVEH